MAFTYTTIADFIFGNFMGFNLSFNKVKNNNRYIAEDLLGDPAANSNNVNITLGDVTVIKELKGSRHCLNFGLSLALNTAPNRYLAFGRLSTINKPGHYAHRAGSIVGAGILFDVTSIAGGGLPVDTFIKVNDVTAISLGTLNLNAVAQFSLTTTQLRGVDTFAEGDILQVMLDPNSAGGTANVIALSYIEVQYDT